MRRDEEDEQPRRNEQERLREGVDVAPDDIRVVLPAVGERQGDRPERRGEERELEDRER